MPIAGGRYLPQVDFAERNSSIGAIVTPQETLNAAATLPSKQQLQGAAINTVIPITYGRDRIGALIADLGLYQSRLVMFVIWGYGPYDALESFTVDDVTPAPGVISTHYNGTQVAPDPVLVAIYGAGYSDVLANIVYSVVQFPVGTTSGMPQLAAVWRGRKLYDPRSGLTIWSDNPSLALADFESSVVYGEGKTVDWDSVGIAADANDELVAGIKRRTFGLTLVTQQECRTWRDTLRTYAGCWVLDTGAGVRLIPDRPTEPVADFLHASGRILELEPLELRDIAQVPTVMEIVWTDTSQLPWREAVAIAEVAGVSTGAKPVRLSRVALPGIRNASQAQREVIERLNALTTADLSTALHTADDGMVIEPGDVIRVSHPVGLTLKKFRVNGVSGSLGDYRFALDEYDPARYSNAVVSESTTPDTDLPHPTSPPPAVTDIAVEVEVVGSGGDRSSQIVITWARPLNWSYGVSYRVVVTDDADAVVSDAITPMTQYRSVAVAEQRTYTVTVQSIGPLGTPGESVSTTVVVPLLPPPPVVRSLAATVEIAGVSAGRTSHIVATWLPPLGWDAGLSYSVTLSDDTGAVLSDTVTTLTQYRSAAVVEQRTYSIAVVAIDSRGSASESVTTTVAVLALPMPEVAGEITVNVDALGIATLTILAPQDPQLVSFELRSGTNFFTGTTLATATTPTFSLPILSLSGLTLWIAGIYDTGGYTAQAKSITFDNTALVMPFVTWRIAESDIIFSWSPISGAAQYIALWEDGGATRITVTRECSVAFMVPRAANSLVRVFALSSTGAESPYADTTINMTGAYTLNEIVNVSLPITTGKYINMAFTTGNQVRRVGLLGQTPAATYAQNINDADLYSFGYNWQNIAASNIQNISATWFRNGFWRERNGFFESAVLDLGSILTGRLSALITKTVTAVGAAAASTYAHVSAEYLADSTPQDVQNTKAFLAVKLLAATDSALSASWTEINSGDWVTARYVRMVVEVAQASALTEITVTAASIVLDVPDVSENGTKTGVTSAGSALVFAKTYNQVKTVIATCRGLARASTNSVTNTGCNLVVDTGTQTVDYFVKGY